MGPLRAKKAGDVKDSIQEALRLAGLYMQPGNLNRAIQKGELWEAQGRLQLEARSIILPNDQAVMTIDQRDYLASRVDFKTQSDGDPVAISVVYARIPNGPSMVTRMTIHLPEEGIGITAESFDFLRRAEPRVN